MHIPDGVLSVPVIAATTALAAGGTALGLRKMAMENVPRAGVLASVFFVASLIHVPIGISSVHL
ncbi:MAG: energy-coupling factor ABC transporter permease, partial [Planctomycetes bacterium]|nr:energy-coupling factor ABC transporter permease [Planctomycetota bacterium]